MSRLRIATIAAHGDREAQVAAGLSAHDGIDLYMRCVDRVELLACVRSGVLDGIVSVGTVRWLDAETVHEAVSAGVAVVAMVQDLPEATRLARLGVSLAPWDSSGPDLARRCGSLQVPRPPAASTGAGRGRIVSVWGPKGAPGRTSMAVELAWALSDAGGSVLLIDADANGGDVAQLLGIVEAGNATILWASRAAAKGELGAAALASACKRVGSGPAVLAGLPRADVCGDVSDFGWRSVLELCRTAFDTTIVDVAFGLDGPPAGVSSDDRERIARAAVAASERVVCVCKADPVGIKNLAASFPALLRLREDGEVVVVANRVRRGQESEVVRLIHRHTGKRPVTCVPDRPDRFYKAVMTARAVSEDDPSCDVAAQIRDLAAVLGGKIRPRGLLAALGGRR